MDNIKKVVEAGVDIVVSGSGIFKTNDPAAMVRKMREVIGP
jgi:ribulose-phosphate 3-epimerase